MPELHGDELHPSYIGLPTYLGTPFAVNAKELKSMNADIAIIGAPVDMGVGNRPGARYGPRAIRQADYWPKPAKLSNLYHLNLEVFPLKEMNVVDFGDANCPPSSLEKSHEAVEKKVTEALDADAIPIVLGGDHSITWPSATAVAKKYGYGNVGMVHFDAHADTRESSYGDVLIGHGSPMRRLIESGAIPGKNFVQVGLRGPWPPPADHILVQLQLHPWQPSLYSKLFLLLLLIIQVMIYLLVQECQFPGQMQDPLRQHLLIYIICQGHPMLLILPFQVLYQNLSSQFLPSDAISFPGPSSILNSLDKAMGLLIRPVQNFYLELLHFQLIVA